MTPPKRTASGLFVVQAALMRPELTRADLFVLSVLIEYTNSIYGYAWPSVETVACVTGLTRRAVQLSLRRLEQAGIIVTETGGGRAQSSRYVVAFNAFAHSPLKERIMQAAAEKANEPSPFPHERANERTPFQAGKGEEACAVSEQKGRTSVRETANGRSPDSPVRKPNNSLGQAKPSCIGRTGVRPFPEPLTFVDAPPTVDLDDAELREVLAALERSRARGELPSPLWAEEWVDWLKDVARVHPGTADAIGARAARLVNDLYAMLPEEAPKPAPPVPLPSGMTERRAGNDEHGGPGGPDQSGSARLKNYPSYQLKEPVAAVLAEMEHAIDCDEASASRANLYLDRLEAIAACGVKLDRMVMLKRQLCTILNAEDAQEPDPLHQSGEPGDEEVDAAERAAIQEIDGRRSGPAPTDRGVTWDDL